MAYCEKCGAKLPENSKFCLNCGNKVEEMQEETLVQQMPVETKQAEQVQEKSTQKEKNLTWRNIIDEWKTFSPFSRFVSGGGYKLIKILKIVAQIFSFVFFFLAIAITFKVSEVFGTFLVAVGFLSIIVFGIDIKHIIDFLVVKDMAKFFRQKEEYKVAFAKIFQSKTPDNMSTDDTLRIEQMIKGYYRAQNQIDDTRSLIILTIGYVLWFLGGIIFDLVVVITTRSYVGGVDRTWISLCWEILLDWIGSPMFWIASIAMFGQIILFLVDDTLSKSEVQKVVLVSNEKENESSQTE